MPDERRLMCGACGRTVVADPVLGPVRTTRDLLVVAQVVNAITSRLPGGPVVRVAGEGWVLAGSTGRSTACDTVEQLWSAVIDSCAEPSSLADLIARALPDASALAGRVLRTGGSAVEPFRGDAAADIRTA